jgi:hypothetical protein
LLWRDQGSPGTGAAPAFAQDPFTIAVAESEEIGQYLADAECRPVYVFSTDTPASGDLCHTGQCCADGFPYATGT